MSFLSSSMFANQRTVARNNDRESLLYAYDYGLIS